MRAIIFLFLLCSSALAEQPPIPWLLGSPPTGDEVELGRQLFFDPRLSVDGTVACATCHSPRLGWSDGLSVSVGIRGLTGTRNAPTIVNACYSIRQFVDGRTTGQATQSLLPLVNPVEMGNQSEQQVMDRINNITGYAVQFLNIFGVDVSSGKAVTPARYARVMAAFQSTVTSFDAPIDRYMSGQKDALTAEQKIGLDIFKQAGCQQCHPHPLYTDYLLHNNGMEFASKRFITDNGKAKDRADKGQQAAANEIRAFKTQPLRNLKLSAPYNHAGNFATVKRCVQHYNRGGANAQGYRDRYIDPRIHSLNLTDTQVEYLTIFLEEALLGADYPMYSQPALPN